MITPIELCDLLDSKVEMRLSQEDPETLSDAKEYAIFKEAIIEIIDASKPGDTLSNIISKSPCVNEDLSKYVSTLKASLKRLNLSLEDREIDDVCKDNIMRDLPLEARTILQARESENLLTFASAVQPCFNQVNHETVSATKNDDVHELCRLVKSLVTQKQDNQRNLTDTSRIICLACGKPGHLQRNFRSHRRFFGRRTINAVDNPLTLPVNIPGSKDTVEGLINTGSGRSLVKESLVNKIYSSHPYLSFFSVDGRGVSVKTSSRPERHNWKRRDNWKFPCS
ncbi:hypothetical protein RF11_16485 [Thelohanellus kitauei]|uniref:CCHC-type domain-containing protein n=1 Tax=Thelohanellus kitauei TaxID=669202 RepID=A0A0C2J5W2_THEKT|nr:hypothetical protein RF11_16485 [Thelohanellus kitauei]